MINWILGSIVALGFVFLLLCFIDLVVLRACYQCGKYGAKKYWYMHSDGHPCMMQYCDECDAAISKKWKDERLIQ